MEDSRTLLADGFEGAFLGWIQRCGQAPVAVYSYDQTIEILLEQGMDYDEALDHMGFNVTGAWLGEGTPGFLIRGDLDELNELCEGQE